MLRAVTEIILEEHGMEMRKYSVHIDEGMNGLLEFCESVEPCFRDLVHPAL